MIEFLKLPLSLISEWMCFAASIFLIYKPQRSYLKLFPAYLFIVVALESYGYYLGWVYHSSNQWLYNLFMPFYGLFHYYIFFKAIRLKHSVAILAVLGCLFGIAYVIEWREAGLSHFFFRTNIVFSLTILILCIVYYYSLFQQEEYTDLMKDAAFWFVTGCLIYFAIGIAVNTFFAELVRLKIKGQIPLRYIITGLINCIMYGCWIKSFLCLKNNREYTPQY